MKAQPLVSYLTASVPSTWLHDILQVFQLVLAGDSGIDHTVHVKNMSSVCTSFLFEYIFIPWCEIFGWLSGFQFGGEIASVVNYFLR